jgi:diguanylate cyclase (GGDEF)-like protein
VANAGTDETDRRLNLTVGLVVVGAVLVVCWAVWTASRSALPPGLWPRVAVVLVMMVLAARFVLQVRIRDGYHAMAMTDTIILVGLMLIPGPWLVLCAATSVTGLRLLQRIGLTKALFNGAKSTIAAAGAVEAARLLHVTGPFTATSNLLPAIIAAAATITLIDEAISMPVLALATRTPLVRHFRKNLDVRLGGTAVRMATTVAAMFLLSHDPKLVIAVPLVIIGLHLASANRLRERAERQAWQKLAQATDELNEVDLGTVLTAGVTRAADLFSVNEVDVEINIAAVPRRLVRGDADTISYDGPAEDAPQTRGKTFVIPLESHDGSADVGELRLRFRGKVSLSEREQYTLRTFAAALCTAVRNAAAFTETQRLAADHAHAAAHDPLTGLANRRHLYELGARVLAERSSEGLTGLLLVDLNHFKEVNDTLGHVAGDQVLIQVTQRLVSAAQPGDIVSRLGGDEFAILFVGLAAPALAVPRARTILAALDQPIEVDGMRIVVEASAGVALAPSRGGIEELLRRADVAMYQAKREGQSIAVYAKARDTADVGRLALTADLPRAVAEHEFTVNFQPIVDLCTGEVLSTEALARWHHPDRGKLDPTRFLDSVERSGLLSAFSAAVLDQALRAAAAWRAAGFDLPVAVNVSPRSLLDPDFPEMVLDHLERAGVPPEGLIVELTESLTLSQLDVVDDALGTLRDFGVRLALDDFGTGYSSLATLARVPVHELKIDRTFVSAMDGTAEAAVVRSTIELGRSLDMLVVAEGVESEEQRRRLWELGCPAGQGHLFARPMPIHRLLTALRQGYGGRPRAFAPPLHDSGAVIRLPTRRPNRFRRDELG